MEENNNNLQPDTPSVPEEPLPEQKADSVPEISDIPEIPDIPEVPPMPEIPPAPQPEPRMQSAPPPVSGYPQQQIPPPYYGGYAQNYYRSSYPEQHPIYYQYPSYPPNYMPSPPQQPAAPPAPPAEPLPMNRKIFVMCGIIAAMIFLLCLYCMISDIMHGALHYDSAVSNTVVLQTQEKPDLDPADENVTADGEYTVRGVAELVKPSIVEVYVYDENHNPNGSGSGIIISEDGYIITNAHVVQGSDYSVTLDNEKEYSAQLIGSDTKTDLAVLKINAANLTPAVLGDSGETYVGETVVAIGNPAGLTNSVTKGIVSAINRQIRSQSSNFKMECIQTDAAISPGNSGGALVNMYGQVIGITSSKYASQYEAIYEGLGFAITINQALPIVQDLIENGYVTGRFRIGIVFMSTGNFYAQQQFQETFGTDIPDKLGDCLWITEISDDCDISNTDLQPNDFILSMNGQKVTDYDSVLEALDGLQGGDMVSARCARYENGRISYFDIEFQLEKDTSGNY